MPSAHSSIRGTTEPSNYVIMANGKDNTRPSGDPGKAAPKEHGRIGKWIRRAQAIVGVRTPGVRKRRGMCEAAERKARRELPPTAGPDEPAGRA